MSRIDWARLRAGVKVLGLTFTAVVVLTAIVAGAYRVVDINGKCDALDEKTIVENAVLRRLAGMRESNVLMADESGQYKDFPLYQFSGPGEYLNYYPDCCKYYPLKIDERRLSTSEIYIEGKCGFVSISDKTHYLANGKMTILPTGGASTWFVDSAYGMSLLGR
jgi:hypothetical protein